jgi:hypothetical protein
VKVTVTDIESQLGNKGITLFIADNAGTHQGKLRIGQATVEWCKGRTRMGNGKKIPMQAFIDMLNDR